VLALFLSGTQPLYFEVNADTPAFMQHNLFYRCQTEIIAIGEIVIRCVLSANR